MIITCIGNCQALTFCFYLQQLLGPDNINWITYGDEFIRHLRRWSDKCQNKITDYDESIEQIKISDIIIFQNVDSKKSKFCNNKTLSELKKQSCKLIQIPSIYIQAYNFDESINELIKREEKNDVDIKVSDILIKYKRSLNRLIIHENHPKTFLFLEVLKRITDMIGIDFFTKKQYIDFMKNDNYMELP
jgi:hypothetical protein